MNKTTTMRVDKRILWGWISIIILAAVVYTVGIAHESFWYDEAYSAVMASYLPWQIPVQVMVDNHPPLYYMLLSQVRMVLGNSEWALRSLSVAGAVGLVALGAGPVRRIFGNRNAFLYAIVVLFTPAILIYAHEARMYSLAICAVTAGALYGYLAVTENRRRDWVLFGVATLAGAYLHYYGLIAAFFMHAFVFFWLLTRRREQLKTYLITGAAVVAAYLPWLFAFIRQAFRAQKASWLGPLSWDGIKVAFLQPFAYKEQFPAITFAEFLHDVTLTQYLAFALAVLLCISIPGGGGHDHAGFRVPDAAFLFPLSPGGVRVVPAARFAGPGDAAGQIPSLDRGGVVCPVECLHHQEYLYAVLQPSDATAFGKTGWSHPAKRPRHHIRFLFPGAGVLLPAAGGALFSEQSV
jgi:4-amino-4-deoxy-L-arabinose transferase-like glycosyltransferase